MASVLEKVRLIRYPSTRQGTLGVLVWRDKYWYTLELPWLMNKSGISCIPVGTYRVDWTISHKFNRWMYLIQAVPNRGGIRMHSGNYAGMLPKYLSDSLGCPLLGKKVGTMNGQLAVIHSRLAMLEFERALQHKSFILEIKNGNR